MKQLFTLLVLAVFSTTSLLAQVHINEYSASNLETFPDDYGRFEDWIELHNTSNIDIDISGYHLSDKSDKPEKWDIPAGTVIPANGFLTFWCSGRDSHFNGNYHTNFKLAQTKGNETLILSDATGIVIDEIPMEITLIEHSRCRKVDGGDEWVISSTPTVNASNDASTQYDRYTVAPSMDVEAGYYTDSVVVTITNNEPNSVLRYTLDGTNPTPTSPEYTAPITVSQTMVIKAQSFSNDENIFLGKMDFNTYFINEDFSLAVFSVAADDVIELANGQGELIPIGSLEYFNLDKEREATSFGSLNRHGQDSWVLDHRSLDWVSRDEMGYSKAVNAEIFSYSDRDEYQKFMFRNSGDDNYPAINDGNHEGSTHVRDEYVQELAREGGLKLDTRAVERVIVFLNGEYWGVYGMRERPVDHDYTDYYYDQGKYEIQYLSTWGTSEAEYGGAAAFNDWYRLRNFILENDMSDSTNYEQVKDEYNVLSLIDYMTVNLNCVASDWLNYNTGWWRGQNPDGDHKKWGYILWDLDATFDYYINYSGVPNTNPDAVPCDIDEISDFMDNFWNGNTGGPGGGGGNPIDDPASCETIANGSSPYPATDTVFQLVINEDNFCCNTDWDGICQGLYDEIEETLGFNVGDCPSVVDGSCPYPADDPSLAVVMEEFPNCCNNWTGFCGNVYNWINNGGGGGLGNSVSGNVGMHEKIFLKLQEENEEFRQLYYSRYADLKNTVYSCENMISTLDRMIGVIEPEMPRQIERWGGSMAEWQQNVQELREFIEERCVLLDEGPVDCFGLEGPFDITLMTRPEGVGEIDINTLELEDFPWVGSYYGGMDNLIKAKKEDGDYTFSHWESTAGSIISPNATERKASLQITTQDTLTAVYTTTTNVVDQESGVFVNVYPNPAFDKVFVKYELEESANITTSLVSMMGQEIIIFDNVNGNKGAGIHTQELDIPRDRIPAGVYLIKISSDKFEITRKVSIVR